MFIPHARSLIWSMTAAIAGADALLCTEKDVWNLRHVQFAAMPVYCCRISFQLPEEFREALLASHPPQATGGGAMKILVRAPNWVGDAVMAIPALEAIRTFAPGRRNFDSGAPGGRGLVFRTTVRGSHHWNTIIAGGITAGWAGRALIRELRGEKFDCAVLLQNAFEAAWLAWRAGIPERIGYARDARRRLLTKRCARAPRPGEIPRSRVALLSGIAAPRGLDRVSRGNRPDSIADSQSSRARPRKQRYGKPARRIGAWRCAIAPGASYGAAKCWPPERFAALADRLISECDADVIFFGTPERKKLPREFARAMKSRAISLVGETSMRDLAALFSACSIFIGNDSGAMHVAAAAGLPVIGIFGSTDPEGTAPVTRQFTLIREAVSCSPCFLRRCPVDHRCMTRISVDSVFSAAQRVRRAAGNSQPGSSTECLRHRILRRAVFLDRDGTICEEMGYVNHVDRLQIFPYAAEAIRQLNQAGDSRHRGDQSIGHRAKYFSGIAGAPGSQENDFGACRGRRVDRRHLFLPAQKGRRLRLPQTKSRLARTRGARTWTRSRRFLGGRRPLRRRGNGSRGRRPRHPGDDGIRPRRI